MEALVKRDPGQRECKERGEKASKKKKMKERKRERKRRRRSWDRESWGRKRMRQWMERRGNYAARRGNWQVENFERRDLQRRSWDLVTNKGGFRRIRRRGADKKLQNCHTVFLRISYLTYSREGEGRVQIYMESWSLPQETLLIACLRRWLLANCFVSLVWGKKVSLQEVDFKLHIKMINCCGIHPWMVAGRLRLAGLHVYSWSCRNIIKSVNWLLESGICQNWKWGPDKNSKFTSEILLFAQMWNCDIEREGW